MRRTALFLLTVLLLTSCVPARVATPAPTATALPTATPVPTLTPTATPAPTLPPEQVGGLQGVPDPKVTNPDLFNLNRSDAPIPQFVNAMEMAGINVSKEEVLQNLTFEYRQYPILDDQGNIVADEQVNPAMKEYVFAVWNLPEELLPEEYKTLKGKIPLLWAEKDAKGWQWRTNTQEVPFRIFADTLGIYIGTNDEALRFAFAFSGFRCNSPSSAPDTWPSVSRQFALTWLFAP